MYATGRAPYPVPPSGPPDPCHPPCRQRKRFCYSHQKKTHIFCRYQVVTTGTNMSSHPDDTVEFQPELSSAHRHYPATSGLKVRAKTDILKICSVFIAGPSDRAV